jgi:flagellar biosynthesis component FlhA
MTKTPKKPARAPVSTRKKLKVATFASVRYFYTILFFLTLFNFSGIPEILPEILGEDFAFCSVVDEESGKEKEKEKEDNKEKEKEKEDVKESMLACEYLFNGMGQGLDLASRNRLLNETGYVPEDHSPPPEFI